MSPILHYAIVFIQALTFPFTNFIISVLAYFSSLLRYFYVLRLSPTTFLIPPKVCCIQTFYQANFPYRFWDVAKVVEELRAPFYAHRGHLLGGHGLTDQPHFNIIHLLALVSRPHFPILFLKDCERPFWDDTWLKPTKDYISLIPFTKESGLTAPPLKALCLGNQSKFWNIVVRLPRSGLFYHQALWHFFHKITSFHKTK